MILIKKGYINPSQEFYLVYKIKKVDPKEFGKAKWDIRKLNGYKTDRSSPLPFATSLTDLMKAKIYFP